MSRRSLASLTALLLIACGDTQATAEMSPVIEAETRTPIAEASSRGLDRYAAFSAVVARHQAMSDRVTRLSRQLRVANAPLCAATRLDAGLITHELSDYPAALRPLALHFMDMGEEGRFIRSIVPGSPADLMEMRIGDQILSGWPLAMDTDVETPGGFFRLIADEACIAPAFVIDAPVLNASTDGQEITLSTALVEQISDDTSLAFIIAHEMAHIIRGHSLDGPRWRAELQADADALTLMRNAGFDISRAVSDWEASVEAHRRSQSMSTTHPPISMRLSNLEMTLEMLKVQPDGFLTLSD